MNARFAPPLPELLETSNLCRVVKLEEIAPGREDKLGNVVDELLWCGANYTVYRTHRGVFVNFSDDAAESRRQRAAFTEICPELCELRYLTSEMDRPLQVLFGAVRLGRRTRDSIFDHNIAQAIMLLMEDKRAEAIGIGESALKLAVTRATSDNTIRYVVTAVDTVIAALVVLTGLYFILGGLGPTYVVAVGAGAVGALFSIITRLRSFELKPCQESNMNHLVSSMRIVMGAIAGLFLALAAQTKFGANLLPAGGLQGEIGAAVLGFIGGFAERLVQTLAQRGAKSMGDQAGTPVQAARAVQQVRQGAAEIHSRDADLRPTRRRRAAPSDRR